MTRVKKQRISREDLNDGKALAGQSPRAVGDPPSMPEKSNTANLNTVQQRQQPQPSRIGGNYQGVLDDPPARRPRRRVQGTEAEGFSSSSGHHQQLHMAAPPAANPADYNDYSSYHQQPPLQSQAHPYPPQQMPSNSRGYSDEEEEGCCVSCIKQMLVVLILTLILGAVGFFSWNVIKDKFFSEEDPSPYQYDPGTDVYGDYAQQGGSNFMVQPPNMAGIESNNPHPGKVHEVHSEQELHQILTTRTAMLSLMFYQSHCGYCHQIDPIYKQLATIFPQSSFLKVNLDVVDMDGEIDSVPTFYFFCETNAILTLQGPAPEELQKATVDAIRVCGQNMAARAVAMQNMPPPPQSRDPPPPAHKYQQLQMILDEQPYDSIRSPGSSSSSCNR